MSRNLYKLPLKQKEEILTSTFEFTFEKPLGFEYAAGQSVDITLITPPKTDDGGNMRSFSLVSAPFEHDLKIATRIRTSSFKNCLKDMSLGTLVQMEGPFGSFNLHRNEKTPAVFLTGGIGITPFISILKQYNYEERSNEIILFYSNKKRTDIPFMEELEALSKQNPNIRIVFTLTEDSPLGWEGEMGRISKEMIIKYIKNVHTPIYYSAGAANLVSGIKKLLVEECGVSEDSIRTEDFPRY